MPSRIRSLEDMMCINIGMCINMENLYKTEEGKTPADVATPLKLTTLEDVFFFTNFLFGKREDILFYIVVTGIILCLFTRSFWDHSGVDNLIYRFADVSIFILLIFNTVLIAGVSPAEWWRLCLCFWIYKAVSPPQKTQTLFISCSIH